MILYVIIRSHLTIVSNSPVDADSEELLIQRTVVEVEFHTWWTVRSFHTQHLTPAQCVCVTCVLRVCVCFPLPPTAAVRLEVCFRLNIWCFRVNPLFSLGRLGGRHQPVTVISVHVYLKTFPAIFCEVQTVSAVTVTWIPKYSIYGLIYQIGPLIKYYVRKCMEKVTKLKYFTYLRDF